MENKPVVTRGKGQLGGLDQRVHTAVLKTDTNKDWQGALRTVIWQPGWEGSVGENGQMCMAAHLRLSQRC